MATPSRLRQTRIDQFVPQVELSRNDVTARVVAFNANASGSQPQLTNAVDELYCEYPTHRPRREYQVECVEAAIKHNCLVSLPTGLGKTFIAAVLLSNILR